MKRIINIVSQWKVATAFMFMGTILLVSCDNELDLPEAGSFDDETPPVANFSATENVNDYLNFTFANLSTSATTYAWDYGDGTNSSTQDGENTYSAEGTYTVSLTASDALGVTSSFSMDILVEEPEIPDAIVPVILEPSFEDLSLPDGTGDGRDSWRNSDLGGVIQINTSSSVPDGGQAAKFPSDGSRIAYQEIAVTPNTDYVITAEYRLEGPPGSVTVAILAGGGFVDVDTANAAAITTFVGNVESGDYAPVTLNFNSGTNEVVSIFITNEGVEARVDNFKSFLN